MKHYLLIIAAMLCLQSSAQSSVGELVRKVGTMIDSMSVKGLDRNYIDAPEKPWQVIARGNVNQSTLSMSTKGSVAMMDYSISPYLRTEPSRYAGLWVGYRGYGLGYTVNTGGDKGSYFTLGAMGGAYGVNLRVHSFKNDAPYFDTGGELFEDDEDMLGQEKVELNSPIHVRTVIADGYYLFNGKRFSYAAAYDQSVLQKRSAGSLMAGAMYYNASIDYADEANTDLIYMMRGLGRMKFWQGSVGVGYAYNWVPVNGLLVSVMAMPMVTVVNKVKIYDYDTNIPELLFDERTIDGEMDDEWEEWFYSNMHITPKGSQTFNSGMTVNFDARLSLTYNFGRYFVNAYGQFNNMRYRSSNSHGHLNDWYVNTSIGLRL